MILKNRPEALSFLAIVIALASIGYAACIVGYQVWTTDADYSFGLQVMLPRLGLIISGFMGACGAFASANKYNQQSKKLGTVYTQVSLILLAIGTALLVYGLWNWRTNYQLIYSTLGPAFVGNGMFILMHRLNWATSKIATVVITAGLLISAFVVASIGRPSPFDVWQFVVVLNGGTGLFILMAALGGSFVMNGLMKQLT
ncbi:hypothetical protein ACK6TQ_02290 [Escherichia coli]|uniref:hypothetical protein n=1 Tax=Enterobacteriaceae TaxID=543 RepID=UPI0013D75DED|nr:MULTISPECIES: hypothetical protein [Enterobacteriaceae]MBG0623491.1 hypothetical protein [Enterobacter roggenkampii]HCJ8641644.1 hypothetical protein [Escherichia coli]MBW9402333.1 hypothetical protein [Leclercia sp. EC_58]MCD9721028.1 hypothetical protein [Klebsiella pneumoniae]MCX2318223.1 hypothetical protein [Klebsiella quasipneumoniae]